MGAWREGREGTGRLSPWHRLKALLRGEWMPPAGPESAEDWERANVAARFGWEARVRYRAQVEAEEEIGDWDDARERSLQLAWQATGRTESWAQVREHVWRGWAAAGSGQAEDRISH